MRVREPLNVTILNQIEVKYYELLVVLFGNPFIDTMESKKKEKKNVYCTQEEENTIYSIIVLACFVFFKFQR